MYSDVHLNVYFLKRDNDDSGCKKNKSKGINRLRSLYYCFFCYKIQQSALINGYTSNATQLGYPFDHPIISTNKPVQHYQYLLELKMKFLQYAYYQVLNRYLQALNNIQWKIYFFSDYFVSKFKKKLQKFPKTFRIIKNTCFS